MKILYHIAYPDGYGDDRFIYDGFRHAFEGLGHSVVPFTERERLAEKLAEVSPDIFITTLHVPNFDLRKEAPVMQVYRAKGMKIFMRAGYVSPGISPEVDTFIELARADRLADVYYSEAVTRRDFFDDIIGRPCEVLPLAADRLVHFPVPPEKKYVCDIVYLGANLPLKRKLFERRLYPLMKKYNVKVFGGDWDMFDRYFLHPLAKLDRMVNLGGIFARWRISRQVPIEKERVVYSSAKIALNFHEQNAAIGPNARIFKIPACGGFEICDPIPMLRDYFTEDEMISPATDEAFFEAVDYYLTHEAERKAMQERATARAQRDHTWHNRVQTMLGWYNR